jgi:protein Tex
VGPKTFEQAAGFLRIRGGENPLDSTAVHPESYNVVMEIANSLELSIEELIRKPELLSNFKKEGLSVGVYTFHDIVEELKKPGRDPRDKFVAAAFNDAIREIADLKPGMTLEGVVTNVTNFGAFVDIGVHQDGLVHISELSDRYVKDPNDVVKVGQIVKATVINADPKAKRIALSMKTGQKPIPVKTEKKPMPARATPPQPKMEDKLAALAQKWKNR